MTCLSSVDGGLLHSSQGTPYTHCVDSVDDHDDDEIKLVARQLGRVDYDIFVSFLSPCRTESGPM
jgi:hypothetical protein